MEQDSNGFYNVNKQIKCEGGVGNIAVADSVRQAEIITKVLNYYFHSEHFTRNESTEMMCKNTSSSLSRIADFVEKHEYTGEQVVEYLREISDELEAQALVVSLRDELKFDKPE
jgi:hypothetical protein